MGAAGMKKGRTVAVSIASIYLQLLLGYGYSVALGLWHPKFKAAVTKDQLSFCPFINPSIYTSVCLSTTVSSVLDSTAVERTWVLDRHNVTGGTPESSN
jgi:ABC-type spermidine/putrescine transport system permease subunit II